MHFISRNISHRYEIFVQEDVKDIAEKCIKSYAWTGSFIKLTCMCIVYFRQIINLRHSLFTIFRDGLSTLSTVEIHSAPARRRETRLDYFRSPRAMQTRHRSTVRKKCCKEGSSESR